MTKIKIEYNPYRCRTKLEYLDSKERIMPVSQNIIERVEKLRMQHYLQPFKGWKGLLAELNESLGDNSYQIIFIGTEPDYRDFARECKRFSEKGNIHFNPQYGLNAAAAANASATEKRRRIGELWEEIERAKIESLNVEDIKANFDSALDSYFNILFTAPVSGGKSTLQNGICGRMYLSTNNNAETAVVSETKLLPDQSDLVGKAVQADDGKTISIPTPITQRTMEEMNKKLGRDKKPAYKLFQFDFPCETFRGLPVIPVMVDTPGPNNAMDKEHRTILSQALNGDEKGVVCVVFPANSIETEDMKEELEMVADAMKNSADGELDAERFLFICNYADGISNFDGEEGTPAKLLKVLNAHGITKPSIFYVCARTAELVRMSRYIRAFPVEKRSEANQTLRQFPDKDKTDYKGFVDQYNTIIDEEDGTAIEPVHTYRYSALPPEKIQELDRQEEKLQNRLRETTDPEERAWLRGEIALINCGVTAIEEAIYTYCEKYSLVIKIRQFHDNIARKAKDQDMLQAALNQVAETDAKRSAAHNMAAKQKEEYEKANLLNKYLERVDQVRLSQDMLDSMEAELEVKISHIQPGNCIKLGGEEGLWCKASDFQNYAQRINDEIDTHTKKAAEAATDYFNEDAIRQMNHLLQDFQKSISELSRKNVFNLSGLKIDGLAPFDVVTSDITPDAVERWEKTGEKWVKADGVFNALKRLNPFGSAYSGFEKQAVFGNVSYCSVSNYLKSKQAKQTQTFHEVLESYRLEVNRHINEMKTEVKKRMKRLDKFIKEQFDEFLRLSADAKELEIEAKRAKQQAEDLEKILNRINKLLEIR